MVCKALLRLLNVKFLTSVLSFTSTSGAASLLFSTFASTFLRNTTAEYMYIIHTNLTVLCHWSVPAVLVLLDVMTQLLLNGSDIQDLKILTLPDTGPE